MSDEHPLTDGRQDRSIRARMNWLRAGVLGANDGIVSIAGLVIGVAGAGSSRGGIVTVGAAGLVAGAISMALGEYVSVSSQRDTERSLLAAERRELRESPERERAELAALYRAKGLSERTAALVAAELTVHDAFAAHAEAELGLDPRQRVNPWHAALASAFAFICGGLLPLLVILWPSPVLRVPATFIAVLLALAVTGLASAHLGGSPARAAVTRIVIGGGAGMLITFTVGLFLRGAA